MAKTRDYDPLACIPSAEIIRCRLRSYETIVDRLRVLLTVAERLEAESHDDPPSDGQLSPAGEVRDA